jgi:carboxypeptidase Q
VPDGVLQGTLGGPGDYAPTVGITQAAGQALAASITGGTAAIANLNVDLTETLTFVSIAGMSSVFY